MNRSLGTRVTIGTAWLAAARVLINLLGLASTLILARLLVPEDFGLVALATTIMHILSSVATVHTASALIAAREVTQDDFNAAWTISCLRGVFLATLCSFSAGPAAIFYSDDRLETIIYFLSAILLFSGLGSPRMVLYSKGLVFWPEFLVGTLSKVASLSIAAYIAYFYHSYWALIIGAATFNLVSMLMSYLLAPYLPKISFRKVKAIWSFSVWLTMRDVLNNLNWRFDHLLVGRFLGATTLGHYTVGSDLAGMPSREAMYPLTQSLFPGFTKVAHDMNRMIGAYQVAQSTIVAVVLPLGFGLSALAEPLLLLVMGPKWLDAVPIIQVLACIFALQTVNGAADAATLALGNPRLLFKRDLVGFVIRVPLITAGLVFGNLPGLLAARAFTGLLGIVQSLYLIKRQLRLGALAQIKVCWRSYVSVVLMYVSVWGIGQYAGENFSSFPLLALVSLQIIGGAMVYWGVHIVLWAVSGFGPGPEKMIHGLLLELLLRWRRADAPPGGV